MALGWFNLRQFTSKKSLFTVLTVIVITISFRIYFYIYPGPIRASHSTHVLLSHPVFESSIGWASGLRSEQESKLTKPLDRPLGEHTLTSDGLLVVNLDGPHPMFQLIRDAEAAWDAKVARASKTLKEAVAEYRRRYRRAPPLGFDKWWDYVMKHDVQIPDEYDEIFKDLQPFWGIDPAELARAQEELEKRKGVVTVHKTNVHPQFAVVGSTLSQDRQDLQNGVLDILALVRDIEPDLPPLRITFSPFDNPSMFSDWRIKAMALRAAANGTTLSRADLPTVTENGWVQACSPDSPARQNPVVPSSLPTTVPLLPSSPKTFIASHRNTMDPCAHPSLLAIHGQFLSHNLGPVPEQTLMPQFSHCSTLLHHDIRPPVPYGWDFESKSLQQDPHAEGDISWESKVDERLGWRGRTTGIWASPTTLWAYGQRARLVTLANALEGNLSMLRVPRSADEGLKESAPVGEPAVVRLALVNPVLMDVAFTEAPIQCDESEGTCGEMKGLWEFRSVQQRHKEQQYKFIIDVDGNGWSGRFKRLMTSNALIFKATIYPEWYTSRIAPWVHYVPIQVSYSDLHDAVAFFRVHDALASRIAEAGRDWSQRFWRREDMTAYLYRLLLEYARVSSLDRASMDYVG